MMSVSALSPRVWLLALVLASACGGSADSTRAAAPSPATAEPPASAAAEPAAAAQHPAQPSPSAAEDPDVAALADRLLGQARELEPRVTPLLKEQAERVGGSMVGLEHRLKTRESTMRKIRLRLAGKAEGRIERVVIDDALRYTIQVEDRPSGHYVRSVRGVLAALEAAGHQVVEVKNYWPRGDNYSGVNSVLRAPTGLDWELQFHTRASLRAQKQGRPAYEEMRLRTTPLERKRELFRTLAAPWESIAIPRGALEEGALHPRDDVIRRNAPN